jgi:hypothetical protein
MIPMKKSLKTPETKGIIPSRVLKLNNAKPIQLGIFGRGVGESQGRGREVVVVPQVSIVLHHTTHQVQERLTLHLAGDALDP